MAAEEFVTVDEKGEITIPKKFIRVRTQAAFSAESVEQDGTIYLRKPSLSELRE